MSSINKILGGLFPHREPKEDEYINEADGLIYCAKCRTPRQCVIQHGDRIVTPPVMCDCQRIAEEKAEAAFKKRQEEFRIERMKARTASEAPFGGSASARSSKGAKSTDAKIDSGRCDFGKYHARNQNHESGRNQKSLVAMFV